MRQLLRQLHDLFLCAFGGIRIAEEMHRAQLQSALCHHITRNRRINAAGQKQCRLSVRADRHAARTGHFSGMDIGRFITDFNRHAQVRIVHIRNQVVIFVIQIAADLLADLDRIERKFFIRALGLDLEALCALQFVRKICVDGLPDGVHILFTYGRTADGDNAKHIVHRLEHLVHVHAIRRLDINGRLHGVHAALADLLQTAAQVGNQTAFKPAAVQTLEHDLAEL